MLKLSLLRRHHAFAAGLLAAVSSCISPLPPSLPGPSSALVSSPSPDELRDPPELIVGHHASLGFETVVGVHRRSEAYELVVERSGTGMSCRSRQVRWLRGEQARELDPLLRSLDPRDTRRDTDCSVSRRDGASWLVGARLEGRPVWRTRPTDGKNEPVCQDFEVACRAVMALAWLSCEGLGCRTSLEKLEGLSWCP